MKRFRITTLALVAVMAAAGITFIVRFALAQGRPEVTRLNGHIMPLMARVVFPNGNTRSLMVVTFMGGSLGPHQIHGLDPDGIDTTIWLDTVDTIEDTTQEYTRFTLKDGTKLRLKKAGRFSMKTANSDGGTGAVELTEVKSLTFLHSARRDKEGHAMFDDWHYSPYTGEELDKIKPDNP
jgi:hypothetical protein